MGAHNDCPHFIPLTTRELVDLLCADQALPASLREEFCTFCSLVESTYHLTYHRHLRALKEAYCPFDPDADPPLVPLRAEEKQRRLNALLREFNWLLNAAHFVHLGREDLESIVAGCSDWGILMDVDFSAFEHIAIFARGDAWQTRTRRRWQGWFQLEETVVPVFRRLVLILKLRRHPRMPDNIDPDRVHLKIFKDIPRMDVDMLLPGATVRLTKLDRGKIAGGFLGGIGSLLYNLASDLSDALRHVLLAEGASILHPERTLWALTAGSLGYGYKTWYGYKQTRQAYHLALTESLYFQALDSNAGVLTRLFDEAEEQDSRTTILAYFCLCFFAGARGFDAEELDAVMGLYLDRYAEIPLVCERGRALDHLRQLGLVEAAGATFRALPLERARHELSGAWERHQPSTGTATEGGPYSARHGSPL